MRAISVGLRGLLPVVERIALCKLSISSPEVVAASHARNPASPSSATFSDTAERSFSGVQSSFGVF